MRSLVAILLLAALPAEAAQPRSCRPSLRDYRGLERGMRYSEVVRRLGCAGRRESGLSIGDRSRSSYGWEGRGSYGANLLLTFRNGRLADKSQLGLE